MNKKAEGYIKYMPFVFATALLFSIMSIYIALVGKQLIDNLLTLHTDVIIKVVCISFVSYIAGAFLGFVTSYLQKFIVDKIKIDDIYVDNSNVDTFYAISITEGNGKI